jgi:hypothetical protein
LKVLVAVAAPSETKTTNTPLDVEAEMQAVLDSVTGPTAGREPGQVRILEVASLSAIREALTAEEFHVLHLASHGSPESVELEDEDGDPVAVTTRQLMEALRHANRPVPLIVLSACSGAANGSQAMAAGLIAQGAERVIAMLSRVGDAYATVLAGLLYRELAGGADFSVGQALARARYLAEEVRRAETERRPVPPEYGLATLLTRHGGDGPLINRAVAVRPLKAMTIPPAGTSVRELPMGALIGRREQLRTATGVLRRTQKAVRTFGVASGVQLVGIGGIGKSAVAGRLMGRLAEGGWVVAVHEGAWRPTALVAAVAAALPEQAATRKDDDVVTIAQRGVQILDGALASAAYLAEIQHFIPLQERARLALADLELEAMLSSGDLTGVRALLERLNQQIHDRAAADPTNTGWQRDLSVSHLKVGDVAVAAGDLTAAATAYQAGLDLAVRLAAADPTNTGWQRDLTVSHDRLGDVAVAAGDLTAPPPLNTSRRD